ncbi:MAG: response regulator, partial [Lachnospiraceae bacterium]|nr:response regulator [Lachnospiraceae bacterium]
MEAACLAVIIYIMVVFFAVRRKKTNEKKVFGIFLINSCITVLLGGLRNYAANNQEDFSEIVGQIIFRVHYIFATGVIFHYFWYLYVLIHEDGRPMKHRKYVRIPLFICMPAIVILPVKMVENPIANYTAGPSAAALYVLLLVYLVMSTYLIIKYRKYIEKRKLFAIGLSYVGELIVLTIQLILPYTLLAPVGITLLCLSLFLTVESPDAMLIERLKDEKEKANAANKAKSVFIANISHEIRTPINVVVGMNEMILRESKEEAIKIYAMDIRSSARTLSGIINDILDLTKLETGKMEIEPVEYELAELIHDLTNNISVRADAKNLSFAVEVDPSLPSGLYGDDVRVKQVITNLLTNAVKYTEKGGVTFKVSKKEEHFGRVVLHIEVVDTGIGIRPENIEKIYIAFERFERARNRYVEGAGLGMNIAQSLLKMMGSKLEVQSVYGEGSTFSFDLEQKVTDAVPVGEFSERIRNKAEEYEYKPSFATPDAKYLVVDDNDANRRVFHGLLKFTGAEIEEVASGFECLDKAKEKKYDIIFLDHMMPGMDGIETLARMKELGGELASKDTPVVIVTANAVSGAKEWYVSKGFSEFISKPVIPEKLEQVIKNVLSPKLIKKPEDAIKEKTRKDDSVEKKEDEETFPIIDGVDWNFAMVHFSTKQLLRSAIGEVYRAIGPDGEALKELLFDDKI